jgi:integrase/recombinase XerD
MEASHYSGQLKQLEDYMLLKGYSPRTRQAYLGAARQYFRYREAEGLSGPCRQQDVRAYLVERCRQGKSWQTVNGDYSSLRLYYRSVLKEEWDVEHIPRPKVERRARQALSREGAKRLIESGRELKHQVFMALLYGTGLRLEEALCLKLGDIDGDRLQVRVERGKGGKGRHVDLPAGLLLALRQYYLAYRPEVWLFNGPRKGGRWPARSAQWAVKEALRASGLAQQATAHTLRHSYATHHLEAGTDLLYLKGQLGHRDLKTTAKYIRSCKMPDRKIEHPIAGMGIRYRTAPRR